ncbi:hypothetical protein BH10PLA2_BH10PLA2_27250 [soil metagenome]
MSWQRRSPRPIASIRIGDSYFLEDSRLPMPPAGLNGFEQLQAAAAALPTGTWPQLSAFETETAVKSPTRMSPALTRSLEAPDRFNPTLLNPQQVKALRSELEKAQKCLTLARDMVHFPNGRGPSMVPAGDQVIKMDSPKYLPMLKVAKALSPDLRLRIFDGDLSGGLQDVSTLLHMSAALADEPWEMPQMLRGAMDWLAAEYLEILLAGGTLSDAELAHIQKELEAELASTKCLTAIRGARAQIDYVLEKVQMQGATQENQNDAVPPKSKAGTGVESISQRIQLAREQADLPASRANGLRLMNEYQRLAKLPFQERLRELPAFEIRYADESFDLWPSRSGMARFLRDEIDQAALLNCAIVAVALERFRLANQGWPEKLENLTPKYLGSVPLDPFDGRPLRMVTKGTTRIVYSIGSDTVDEGGKVSSKFGGRRQDIAEIGFILHDPEQRRRPAPAFVFPEREKDIDKPSVRTGPKAQK